MASVNANKTSAQYKQELLEVRNKISDLQTEVTVKNRLLNSTSYVDPELRTITTEEIKTAEYAIKALQAEIPNLEYLITVTSKFEADGSLDEIEEELNKKEDETTKEDEEIELPEDVKPNGHPDCGCLEEDSNGDGVGDDTNLDNNTSSGTGVSTETCPDHLVPPLGMRSSATELSVS